MSSNAHRRTSHAPAEGGRGRPRFLSGVLLALPLLGAAMAVFAANATAAPTFAATASISSPTQYLGDTAGTTYTVTVKNTGSTNRIAAVEVIRPTGDWKLVACPAGPAGWTRSIYASGVTCRYVSAATSADDIPPGGTRTFSLKATSAHGKYDRAGTWRVRVSKTHQFTAPPNTVDATPSPSGALTTRVYTWQVVSAPITGSAVYGTCPALVQTAHAGATKTVVVCAKNHAYTRLTPSAAHSSLGGTFVGTPGAFGSVSAPARSATFGVANWVDTTVTSALGSGKTVVTRIGSASNQTSPLTTLTGYVSTNVAPVAVADAFDATEDTGLAGSVLANDTDADGDALTATLGVAPAHGDLTLNPDGSFTYTPDADYSGSDGFTYTANDGFTNSAVGTVTIAVAAVNDGPANTVPGAQTVLEDAALTLNGISVADVDSGAGDLTVTLSAAKGALTPSTTSGLTSSTGSGTGTLVLTGPLTAVNAAVDDLSYQPAANANGSDTLTMLTSDNGSTGAGGVLTDTDTVDIAITSVNDAPSATLGADQTVVEDSAAQSVAGWATAISAGPADEAGQAVDFLVTNDDNSLFSAQPAVSPAGTLTYTPAADQYGTATVTVYAHDDGGTANGGADTGPSQTFTITIKPVNDAPTFDNAGNLATVLEDAGAQSVPGWATNMSKGPASESGQALTFGATNDNNGLFSAQPSVAPDGTLTYTPAPDANGTANITVTLTDDGGTADGGDDSSAPVVVSLTVTPVNDAPSFTKGADGTVLEDAGAQSVSGWATAISSGPADEAGQTVDFVVTNDNSGLFWAQPAVSPTGTLTYTPAANANGSTTVTVAVHDDGGTANGGDDTSDTQTFTITVTPVNDEPSFTKGADQTVNEDAGAQSTPAWASNISAGPSNESAQTVSFGVTNDDNALFSAQPAVSADGTLTYTPAPNANGSATVTISVSDNGGTSNGGVDTSPTQTFTITVNSVNDVPSFAKGANQTVLEDDGAQSVSNWATAISSGPADEAGQAVSFTTSNDDNGLFSVQPGVTPTGTLVYTPAPHAFGSATVTISLSDTGGTANGGDDTSDAQTFTITVNPVNDEPSFTKGADQVVVQDSGAQTVPAWATSISAGPSNESGQAIDFGVTNDDNALFSAQPAVADDGTLTYTPASGAIGSATVSVTLTDDGGTLNGGDDTSVTQTFTITVSPPNATPTADATSASGNEDGGAITVTLTGHDADGDALTFTAGNAANGLVTVPGSVVCDGMTPSTCTATSTYTPNANFFGSDSFTYTVNDGTVSSASATASITVNPVNDAPTFTPGGDPTVNEDSGAYSAPFAADISAGPANESSQTVSFDITNNTNPGLFAVDPAISGDGTLTFTPAANANGSASITYNAEDDGGTANGGDDTSGSIVFTITVNPVNDAPSFTKGADQTLLEDAGAQSVSNWASAISKGPGDESAQTLSFTTSNDNNDLFSVQPGVTPTGTLVYTAAPNAVGSATVTISLSDNGGTANGGDDTSDAQTFTITVNPVNDAPSFTHGGNQTVLEDAGAQTVNGFVTGTSAGPADESAQTVTVSVVGNDNNGLFSAAPSITGGTLTYTPAADANGSAIVTVRATDDGGTANGGDDTSNDQTFTITVTPVNDAPSFTKGPDLTVNEDAGAQSYSNWATAISKGPANESAQVLDFIVTNDNNALFSSQPAVSPTGTLSFTSGPNKHGTATVSVSLHDNGGTANGGDDTSDVQTFTITVNPVNDAPVAAAKAYTVQANMRISLGGLLTGATDTADTSQNPGYTPTYTLGSITAGAGCVGCTISNVNNANGTFDFDPPAGGTGTYTVTYTVVDSGDPAPGVASAPQTITFTVNGPVIWFVDTTASAGGTGRLSAPFNTLGGATSAMGTTVNQRIFARGGNVSGNVSLPTDGWILSEAVTGPSFDSVMGITPPAGTIARPGINGTQRGLSGSVTVGNNSVVRGFDLTPPSGTPGLVGNGKTGLVVNQISATTTGARAVDLANSSGTFTFSRVASSGAQRGISLVNTNVSTGSFTVTGTGTAGSGGTITGSTGAGSVAAPEGGIYLNNTKNVSLDRMVVSNSVANGIYGKDVTTFSLANSSVSGNGTDVGLDHDGVRFDNVLGTSSITNSTVTGSEENNVRVTNTSGTANLTVTGSTFSNNDPTVGANGVIVDTHGNAVMTFAASGNTFTNNNTDGLAVYGQSTGAMTANIGANTFNGNMVGIDVASNGTGPATFVVDGVTVTGCSSCGAPINLYKGTGATGSPMVATVRNSTVNNGNSGLAPGIWVHGEGAGTLRTTIQNNTVRGVQHFGIYGGMGNGNGSLDMNVTGNDVDVSGTGAGALYGIYIESGLLAGDANATCANIKTNKAIGGAGLEGIAVANFFNGSFRLPGFAGGTDTAAESFIVSGNTAPVTVDAQSSSGSGFIGGAACNTP